MNKLILWICALILPVLVLYSCSSDSTPTSSIDGPNGDSTAFSVQFEEETAIFKPGMLARILVEGVDLEESEYVGETLENSVVLFREFGDDPALLMPVPELEPGDHSIILTINEFEGELNFEVDEYEPLQDPEQFMEEFVESMEEAFNELLDGEDGFVDSEPVETVLQEFQQAIEDFEQLDEAKKRMIARFIGLLQSNDEQPGDEQPMELLQDFEDSSCGSILEEMSRQQTYWESISLKSNFRLNDSIRAGVTTGSLFLRTHSFLQRLRSIGNCDEKRLMTDDLDSDNRIVFVDREGREIDVQLREEWMDDYQEPIGRFLDYVLQLSEDFPEPMSDYLNIQSGITHTKVNLRRVGIEEISSSSIEGTVNDSGELLFRYTGGPMTEESQGFNFLMVLGKTKTRFDAVIEGSEYPFGGPYEPQFEIDGVGYSSTPVTQGYITGFGAQGAPAVGIDVDPGRLWFGNTGCYGFSVDGTGSADPMGGRGLDRGRFSDDLVTVATHPILATAPEVPSLVPSEQFHPDFDRFAVVESFSWGVELDEDGFPKLDFDDRWTFYIEFDEESEYESGAYLWEEGESKPAVALSYFHSAPLGNLDRDPTDSPYCYWREVDMIVDGGNPPVCKTMEMTIFPYGTMEVEECFYEGVRHGDYSISHTSGEQLVRGSYNKGLRSGPWSLRWPDGSIRLTGEYNEMGMRIGEWNSYSEDGYREYSVTIGAWEETPFGIHEVLSGTYRDYTTSHQVEGSYLWEEGVYRDGYRDGWWAQFDVEGRRERGDRYNSQMLVGHPTVDEYCTDDGTHCISAYIPRREMQRVFSWGSCVVDLHFVTEREFANDGSEISRKCYEFSDDPNNKENPDIGGEINCPVACDR